MSMANRFAWKEFTAPILMLLSESKLTKNEFYKSRNKLKQFALIDFKERGGNRATIYKINSVVSLYEKQIKTQTVTQNSTQMVTQTMTQNVNINKTRNQKIKTKNKKEIIKEKFGEFDNVLLSPEEFDKLKVRFGEQTESYIERLSNYVASTGKRYKSHYATILNWAEKDSQNNKIGGENYGNDGNFREKPENKKLCTEYPE